MEIMVIYMDDMVIYPLIMVIYMDDMDYIYDITTGWWLTYPSENYDGVKVSWDDEIPNWMEK